MDRKILKDAVDPEVIETSDGQLKLFYCAGLFTKTFTNPKPNKFYSAISKDIVNFAIEGIVERLEDANDPMIVRLKDGCIFQLFLNLLR